MKTTINEQQFITGFDCKKLCEKCPTAFACNRGDNFSYEGRKALFSYFEELEGSCEFEIEYDPIAICCEYSEYDSAIACVHECGYDCEHEQSEDVALDYLRDNTQVVEFSGGIIIQDF